MMLPARTTAVSLVSTASPRVAAEAASHSKRSVRTNRANIQKASVMASTAGSVKQELAGHDDVVGHQGQDERSQHTGLGPVQLPADQEDREDGGHPEEGHHHPAAQVGVPELNRGDRSVGSRRGWARKIGNWLTKSGLPARDADWPA